MLDPDPMGGKSALLQWFDAQQRQLPWRENRDPYRIWVSEIMLQQTQVKTVIPYYEAFLARFPDVERLAEAPVEEVLALWSGLGYYRRARQLHQAAQQIVEAGGEFPSDSLSLRELPGIGPYTAAAVASMAFDEVVPVLDGNVERVLCRREGLELDPKKSAVRRRLLELACELLDPSRPGDSNQAMMELGALVCRPKAPDCSVCPLQQGCRAFEVGEPERFPQTRKRRGVERRVRVVAVVRRHDRLLMFLRPPDSDVLPGMWELPNIPEPSSREAGEAALAQRYGGTWQLGPERGRIKHGITFRSFEMRAHEAEFSAGDQIAEGPGATWVRDSERDQFAVSSMVGKILELFS